MRHALNGTWSTLLRSTTAIVIALSLAACKDKMPPDPRSPPKPRMERSAAHPPIDRGAAVWRETAQRVYQAVRASR